jgi:hypothetical protein
MDKKKTKVKLLSGERFLAKHVQFDDPLVFFLIVCLVETNVHSWYRG